MVEESNGCSSLIQADHLPRICRLCNWHMQNLYMDASLSQSLVLVQNFLLGQV